MKFMELKSGYDFALAAGRARYWAKIEEEEPSLVSGSPACTLFSRLQELNKCMSQELEAWMERFQSRMQQAKKYVREVHGLEVWL